MTYQEFLEKLAKTKGNWELKDKGEIRSKLKHHTCPGLAMGVWGVEHGVDFATCIDVGPVMTECAVIAEAADNFTKGPRFDPKVRKDLLDACGLSEKANEY